MSYAVKTSVFEGPLDLLLQLIMRHQVDVAAVSLSEITNEYLEHIEEMARLELEVTSEFLLIAATLLQLKARRLLPSGPAVELDEDLELMEERDRLLARLLQCVTFKDVASVIEARMRAAGRHVPHTGGIEVKIRQPAPDFDMPVDPTGLAAIAERVFSAPEPDLDHLDLELPSVQSAVDELRARMAGEVETTFEHLVAHCTRKVEIAAYFLALLELARWGMVELAQADWMAAIEVRHRESAGGPIVSEWAL